MAEKLREVFSALQDRLSADLAASAQALRHPVAQGDATESNWLAVLSDHLPQRYSVARGTVVDAQGEASEQIDLLIYDRQYTPLLFNQSGQQIIPAEAVYAVFEVKPVLDRANVLYAGKKVASVRRLQRTSTKVVHAGGQFQPRAPFRILGGILAARSGWKSPVGPRLDRTLSALAEEQWLDLGCAIQGGTFQAERGDDGSCHLQTSGPETALAELFLRLLARLQALGTAPAISYPAYGAAFGIALG